jgi:hypothetical protein
MIILLVLAAAVVSTPIAAAVLVSLASRREDARHSLGGTAPSLVTRAARRLLRASSRGSGRGRVPPAASVPYPRMAEEDDIVGWLTGPHAR